jgi:hypothetical protein
LDAVENEGGLILSLRIHRADIPVFLRNSRVIDYVWREGEQIIRPKTMKDIAEEIMVYGRLSSFSSSEGEEMEADPIATDQIRIVFEPGIDAERMVRALTALANYYRACGGAGLTVELEPQVAYVRDLVYG